MIHRRIVSKKKYLATYMDLSLIGAAGAYLSRRHSRIIEWEDTPFSDLQREMVRRAICKERFFLNKKSKEELREAINREIESYGDVMRIVEMFAVTNQEVDPIKLMIDSGIEVTEEDKACEFNSIIKRMEIDIRIPEISDEYAI